MVSIDTSNLMDAGAQLCNGLIPVLIVVVGIAFGFSFIRWITSSLNSIDAPTRKIKNTESLIDLPAEAEKSKRGLVKLGDDGELVNFPDDEQENEYTRFH